MSGYSRFGIYYVPAPGALADFGARWLGWDIAHGTAVSQPDVAEICNITMTPRKYGFHGTLKPPFRLAQGLTDEALRDATANLAGQLAPVTLDGLSLSRLGRFLALTPHGDVASLARLAARIVQDLDGFRAPAAADELERRRAAGLNPAQEANLLAWGYPYVLDEFRFHLTLTGKLGKAERRIAESALAQEMPALPEPFVMDAIALVGERADGMFELLHRYALTG